MMLWQHSVHTEKGSSTRGAANEEAEFSRKYERKLHFTEPQLLFAMLNNEVSGVYANDKFCIFKSEEGSTLYSTGYDFREVTRDDMYGIPRQISISFNVSQISVGRDHALILTEVNKVFAFGSNLYGQLGVNKNTGLHYHLHPLTK